VGAGINDPDDVRFMAHYLFGDSDGQKAAGRIDRCIDRLPGLSGLGLVARSAH
jgi:hypothetical protein